MARRNRAAAGQGAAAGGTTVDDPGASGALALEQAPGPMPMTGPHDGELLDPEVTSAAGVVDFGAMQVPVPPGGTVTVEPTANGRMQAVHIALAGGRLSVSALAAPKSSKLWPDLAREIDKSLRDGGARVRSYSGEWGRELHATSGKAKSVFVGVDGPRWMLYGVATGPEAQSDALEAELRRMLRGTVVVRGKNPYPVRTVLPLVVPEHLAEEMAAAAAKKTAEERPAAAQATQLQQAQPAAAQQAAAQQAAQQAAAEQAAAQQAAAQQAAAQQTQVQQVQAGQQTQVQQAQQPVQQPVQAPIPHPAQQQPAPRPGPGFDGGTQRISLPPRPAQQPAAAVPVPAAAPEAEEPPTIPLRELSPSARRAAAGAWRNREAEAASHAPPGRPAPGDADYPTEVWGRLPAEPAAPPPAPAPPAGTDGRRHLAEPPAGPGPRRTGAYPAQPAAEATGHHPGPAGPDADPSGRRHLPDQPAQRSGAFPPAPETGGRRRLIDPAAAQATGWLSSDAGTATGRWQVPWADGGTGAHPARPANGSPVEGTGQRRAAEPGSAGPARPGPEATGRRHAVEPGRPPQPGQQTGSYAPRPTENGGRRHLAEPPAAPVGRSTGAYPAQPTGSHRVNPPRVDPPRADPLRADAARSDPSRAEPPRAEPWSGTGRFGQQGPEATGRRRPAEPTSASGAFTPRPGVEGTGRARPAEQAGGASGAHPAPSAEPTGRRRLADPAGSPSGAFPAGRDGEGAGRRRLAEPTGLGTGAYGPVGGTSAEPGAGSPGGAHGAAPASPAGVEGTGRRRASDADSPSGRYRAAAAAEGAGRRRLAEPSGFGSGAGEPAAGPSPQAEPGPESTGRRRAADPVHPPTGWQPAVDGEARAGSNGRRHRSAPEENGGGRRRLPEPDATAQPAESTGGHRRTHEDPDPLTTGAWLPASVAERVVESTGRRRRTESSTAAEPAAPPAPPSAEPRAGRRRAADPNRSAGTRRTLGAEYLIDTGEQAVWTGGARRYAPQPEPPTEPIATTERKAPEPAAAAAEHGRENQGTGRHIVPAAAEAPGLPATVPLRALIGDLDPDRPSGRHRRPN